ncbi:hypothetical protein EXS71_02315 [Candidatus Uhrbacteria bacterium]|nr:hypothetical protein [Candidatus Uhrbacteria bacterium]
MSKKEKTSDQKPKAKQEEELGLLKGGREEDIPTLRMRVPPVTHCPKAQSTLLQLTFLSRSASPPTVDFLWRNQW